MYFETLDLRNLVSALFNQNCNLRFQLITVTVAEVTVEKVIHKFS